MTKDSKHTAVSNSRLDNVACPFCGLLCDDLGIALNGNAPQPVAQACALSRSGFAKAALGADAQPQVNGKPATLPKAIDTAATLLMCARHPVFVAQGADVAAARALLSLADMSGAVVDHSHSAGLMRNVAVLQDAGWMTATLSEVRNRADLFVLVGEQIFELFPRLAERVLLAPHRLYTERSEIVLLGPWDATRLPAEIQAHHPEIIPAPMAGLNAVAGMLRALLKGQQIQSESVSGIATATLRALAKRMRAAQYSVLAWAAAEFDFPHAELTIQQFVECVRELNVATRASALPLGGNRSDMTLNQVCTWQSGYPLRTDFQRGYPRFDARRNDHIRLLGNGEADLLLWLSPLDPEALPPLTNIPTLVVGHPAMQAPASAAAFIPVGIPGIDHAGHFYRSDNVVAVPLRALRKAGHAPAAEILHSLEERLRAQMNPSEA